MKSKIAYFTISLMWLGIPLSFALGLPDKFSICLYIVTAYMAFSHICLTFIYSDLIKQSTNRYAILHILAFGALGVEVIQYNDKPIEQS